MIDKIDYIIEAMHNAENERVQEIQELQSACQSSAKNLIHYRTLRTIDITELQRRLGDLGLSRIARAESHVMASLENCRFILRKLLGEEPVHPLKRPISIKRARKILNTHSKDLLGYRSKGRRVRIMVTLPSEAAHDYELVEGLLAAGMNTARINCAHDGPEEWQQMIDNVARAREKLNKNCRISMDLAGPKIRTGPIEPGPRVRRFKPSRNELGQVVEPALINLVTRLSGSPDELPVDGSWLLDTEVGNHVKFRDAREKKRTFLIKQVGHNKALASSTQTSYVQSGLELRNKEAGHTTTVGELPPLEQAIFLKNGDVLRVIKEQIPGRPAQYDEGGDLLEPAFISCTSQEVFNDVKIGEKILFDDGKIRGTVLAAHENEIKVEIVHAGPNGTNLKADKGINLPETDLKMSGLTDKDREDLKFITTHADVVNFSFVNSPQDVQELLDEFEKLDAVNKLGIILKIETQAAYNNLTEILLAGMKNYPLGVMIARGDLAIESGWENIGRIQQEILYLCNAAHVPEVWATQVLESLAKKGIPSRSEITDATTSLNAECVMLNKGPYILEAVKLLDYILKSLNQYRDKNVKMTPVMQKADLASSP